MDMVTNWSAGLGLGTSFPLFNLGHDLAPGLAWTKPIASAAYAIFGGGATILGLGIADGSLFANITRGRSQSLIRSEIVSSDGQAATLHIGDRYPIVTSQFVGATAQPGENVVAPPPTFNFEDLGLVLKVTPVVHGMDEMSLEVETEFKTLGAEGTNGIPIINTRKLQSRVRMKNSEWAIVAGLASESELSTLSGFAGLANIPVLGKILSRNTRTRESAQVLVLIKPKLLSAPPSTRPTRLFWLGTETKPLTSL